MADKQQIALLKRQLKSIKRKRDALKKELKRHREAVEYYRTWLKNEPLRMEKLNGKMAKEALKRGDEILGEKG